MNTTSISWTDYTSNPLYVTSKKTGKRGWHCEKVSPGCAHCYSATLNNDQGIITGTGYEFLPWNRDKVDFHVNEKELREWAKPKYAGSKCFICDMTDLFGEWVSDETLDRIFAAMALAPGVTFQVLTKRPERMQAYLTRERTAHFFDGTPVEPRNPYHSGDFVLWEAQRVTEYNPRGVLEYPTGETMSWPLPNVWLGVTCENQRWADARIPVLLDTPAAVRFVSAEPLLGPVDLRRYLGPRRNGEACTCGGKYFHRDDCATWAASLSWVIVGGESGSKRRPMDVAWAESLVAQCHDAGVACWVKQDSAQRPGQQGRFSDALWATKEYPNV